MADLLAAIRDRVELDLGDAANTIWSTAELDRHIAHALEDLGRASPRETTSTAVLTSERAVASVTGSHKIIAVEYPLDIFPRHFRRFSYFANTVEILDDPAPGTGVTIRLYKHEEHSLTAGASTLREEHEDILIKGAVGYALRQAGTEGTNALNTGGANVDRDYKSQATEVLREFRADLTTLRPIKTNRFYVADDPLRSQTTDPGP